MTFLNRLYYCYTHQPHHHHHHHYLGSLGNVCLSTHKIISPNHISTQKQSRRQSAYTRARIQPQQQRPILNRYQISKTLTTFVFLAIATKMPQSKCALFTFVLFFTIVVLHLVDHANGEPKFGRGGGGRGGGSRGGSRHSSSGGGGSWFSNLFSGSKSKSVPSSSSSSSSAASSSSYPRQPAHNPSYSASPPAYDTIAGVRQPPSYGSLGGGHGNYAGFNNQHQARVPPPTYTQSQSAYGFANYAGAGPVYVGSKNGFQSPHQSPQPQSHFGMFTPQTQSNYAFNINKCQ